MKLKKCIRFNKRGKIMYIFAVNLKYYRIKKWLSRKQLAERCGLSVVKIRELESSKVRPDIETIKIIADALDVYVMDFLYDRNKLLCWMINLLAMFKK